MHDSLQNLQCSANCATKLRLVKQANSLPLTPLSATPQSPPPPSPPLRLLPAPSCPSLLRFLFSIFNIHFSLLDATLTLAEANAAGVRSLLSALRGRHVAAAVVACSSAPMRCPQERECLLPLSLPRRRDSHSTPAICIC